MDLRRLTCFVSVAEHHSISAAATVMKLAQPSVSRHLVLLEKELGTVLFIRHGRGVALTEAGECLLKHANNILNERELIRDDLSSLSNQPQGEVTVGVTAIVGPILAPRLLRRLKLTHSGINVHIYQGLSEEIRRGVLDRNIDVGIFHCMKPNGSFAHETLDPGHLHLIGPRNSNILANSGISFNSISSLPLVLPPKGHELRQSLEEVVDRLHMRLNVQFQVDAYAIMKEMIQTQGIYTILPVVSTIHEIDSGHLLFSRIFDPIISRPLILATRSTVVSTAARLVAHITRLEFQDLLRSRDKLFTIRARRLRHSAVR